MSSYYTLIYEHIDGFNIEQKNHCCYISYLDQYLSININNSSGML
jgi:hypothetical protein